MRLIWLTKRLVYSLAGIVSLIALMSLAAAEAQASDELEASAKQFIVRWIAAFDMNDPKHHMTFYEDSEELEVIISAGLRHKGHAAVSKTYHDDQKSVRFYESAGKNIETRILGNTALVSFEHHFKLRMLADDSHWRVHIRTSTVLHRTDGKWKIVQEHSSPIQGVERFVRILE